MEFLAELGGLGNITAGAILAIVIFSIVSGKLIPERMHDRITDALKDENATLKEVRIEYREQNATLLENDEAILKFLRALDNMNPPSKFDDNGDEQP